MRKPTKKTATKTSAKKATPKKSGAKKSATAPNRETTAIGPRKTRAMTKPVKNAAPGPKKRAVAPPKKAAQPAPRKIGKSPDLAAGFKGGKATSSPARPRGRPRKMPTSMSPYSGIDNTAPPPFTTMPADAPVKRGRGRPRKILVVETLGSDTLTSSLANLPDSVSASPRKTGNSRKSAPRI